MDNRRNEYKKKWRAENFDKKEGYRKKHYDSHPWAKHIKYITSRCNSKTHHYGKKGIKNELTVEEVKFVWFRDKAHEMDHPSIDRLDEDKNYTLDNVRFIELSENKNRRSRGLD